MGATTTTGIPADDQSLLGRMRAGDEGGLEALYERYGGLARRVAQTIVTSPQSAEEVVQDAFLSAWRRADTYDERAGRVQPWLLAIVRHRAIDRLRRASERARHAQLDDAWMAPSTDDPLHHAEAASDRARLRSAVDRLPRDQRRVISLAYFDERSMCEIAGATRSPLGTVKSRARLGLGKLRTMLDAGECC